MNTEQPLKKTTCTHAYQLDNVMPVEGLENEFSLFDPGVIKAMDFVSVGFKTASGNNIRVSGASLNHMQKLNLMNDQSFENSESLLSENKVLSTPALSSLSTKNFVPPGSAMQQKMGNPSILKKSNMSKGFKGNRHKKFISPMRMNQQDPCCTSEVSLKCDYCLPERTLNVLSKKVATPDVEKAKHNATELFSSGDIMEEYEQLSESIFLESILKESSAAEGASVPEVDSLSANTIQNRLEHQNPCTGTIKDLIGFKTASGKDVMISNAALDKIQKMNLLDEPPVEPPVLPDAKKMLQFPEVDVLPPNSSSKVIKERVLHNAGFSKKASNLAVESQNHLKNSHSVSLFEAGLLNNLVDVCSGKMAGDCDDKNTDLKFENICEVTEINDSKNSEILRNAFVRGKLVSNNCMPDCFHSLDSFDCDSTVLSNKQKDHLNSISKHSCNVQCNYFEGKKCSKPTTSSRIHVLAEPRGCNCANMYGTKLFDMGFESDMNSGINAGAWIHRNCLSKANLTFVEAICGFYDIVGQCNNDKIEQPINSESGDSCGTNHANVLLLSPSVDGYVSFNQVT